MEETVKVPLLSEEQLVAEKPARTAEVIQGEYLNVCAQIGERKFRIEMEHKAIQDLVKKAIELNAEYAEVLK